MADRTALGMIGLMLGAATMMVVTIGGFVVNDTLNGRVALEDSVVRVGELPTTTLR